MPTPKPARPLPPGPTSDELSPQQGLSCPVRHRLHVHRGLPHVHKLCRGGGQRGCGRASHVPMSPGNPTQIKLCLPSSWAPSPHNGLFIHRNFQPQPLLYKAWLWLWAVCVHFSLCPGSSPSPGLDGGGKGLEPRGSGEKDRHPSLTPGSSLPVPHGGALGTHTVWPQGGLPTPSLTDPIPMDYIQS